jgi:hypothetical protein
MAILALSRPYEGLLVCLPAVAALCWYLANKSHPPVSVLKRRSIPGLAPIAIALAFMAYYDYRVFGSAFTPPYALNRATYAIAPQFLWESARPAPVYRHPVMREFYSGVEMAVFKRSRTLPGFLKSTAERLAGMEFFFVGFALLLPLVMLPRALRDRRLRFLAVSAAVFATGQAIVTGFMPHYAAPFTAGLYALLLQSMRHLRAWRPQGRSAGLFLVRAIPILCFTLAGLRIYAEPLHIFLSPEPHAIGGWFGANPLGLARAHVLKELESQPGKQLALVRYSPAHNVLDDWVYNAADIDKSSVVWARDMGAASNQELLLYYKDRTVWLVEPDTNLLAKIVDRKSSQILMGRVGSSEPNGNRP